MSSYDDATERTDTGLNGNYNSDFEEDGDYDLGSGLNSEDEFIRQAQKSGRWCQKCTRIFESIEAHHSHLKTSKQHQHHLCHYCNNVKDYRTLKNLQRHWQERHGSLYCELCSEKFSSPADKQKHSESQHYACERCEISFKSQGCLRYHWASSKAHESTYCRPCKLDFADPGAYNSHIDATHRSEPSKGASTGNDAGKDKTEEKKNQEQNAETGNSRKFYRSSNSKGGKKNFREGDSSNDGKKKPREGKSKKKKGGSSRDHSANMPHEQTPPNHYAMLGIPSISSAEDIAKASRQRRIDVHPDRLKRQDGLSPDDLEAIDTEAKNVGFAAEVLGNEKTRRQYDRIYQLWY